MKPSKSWMLLALLFVLVGGALIGSVLAPTAMAEASLNAACGVEGDI